MSDTTNIAALIEAVKAGQWPLDPQPWMTGAVWTNICGAYNGSLDAAKALHDALLPGWWFQISAVDGWATCHIARSGEGVPRESPSVSETPARAWLLAILRAYQSQQETGQ